MFERYLNNGNYYRDCRCLAKVSAVKREIPKVRQHKFQAKKPVKPNNNNNNNLLEVSTRA